MKKLFALLIMFCFVISGCSNKVREEKPISSLSDLENTTLIEVKRYDSDDVLYSVKDKEDINAILEIILNGEELEEGEIVPYVAAYYTFDMINSDDALIEVISMYLPFGSSNWVSLRNLGVSYHVEASSILEIVEK